MNSSPVRVLLVGAAGRMGKTIIELAKADPAIEITAQCDLGDSIEPAIKSGDVAIDVSNPDAITEICRAVLQHDKSLVIGSNAPSQIQSQQIEDAEWSLSSVFAINISVGAIAI